MLRRLSTRVASMIVAVFTVLTVIFFSIRLGTGDPTAAIQGSYATQASIAALRHALGLDKPLLQQYVVYLTGLVHGNLSVSLQNGQSVLHQIIAVVPYTFDLTVSGLSIGLVLGVPLGFVAAVKRNSLADHVIRIVTLTGISIPPFIMGYFLIIVFVIVLNLFPVTGGGNLSDPGDVLRHLVLPAFSLGLIMTSYITRLTRTTVLEILAKDFVRTARAKGLKRRVILTRYVFRLSLVTIVTLVGLYATITVGSSVVIEVVFGRPGVGQLIVDAVTQSNYTVVQGAVIFYAIFVGVVNLLVDVAYTFIDPRIGAE